MSRGLTNFAAPAALAAWLLAACASAPAPAPMDESSRPALDRMLARMVSKGEMDRAMKTADSVLAARDPADREIAIYWKSVAWLYRDEPDSALALLEGQQGKWSAGLRKVHGALLLKLTRESVASRAASHWRPEDAPKAPAADKGLLDRVESLQKESAELKAENQRLETEKEKYKKLLKDLETIR